MLVPKFVIHNYFSINSSMSLCQGVFIVYAGGIFTSALALVLEFYKHKTGRQPQQSNHR